MGSFAHFSSLKLAFVAASALTLTGCYEDYHGTSSRHRAPLPAELKSRMDEKGMDVRSPMLVRIFKQENELEVWKKDRNGQYALLKTYPICRWSGQLGPKMREGDRQAPEGFYSVSSAQLNPNSQYHLSFDLGYPNSFDRAHGGTGSHLMVHGSCSSRGCYAMTDKQIEEIYAMAREAMDGGQKAFQVQALPFRMTPKNLARHRLNPHMAFWKQLKEGSDHFEVTKQEPKIAVCAKRYVFNATAKGDGRFVNTEACPPLETDPQIVAAVQAKALQDQAQVAELIAQGEKAVKVVYEDGHQHETFRKVVEARLGSFGSAEDINPKPVKGLGEVSRPYALAQGPREIRLDDALTSRASLASKPVVVASAPLMTPLQAQTQSAALTSPQVTAEASSLEPAPARKTGSATALSFFSDFVRPSAAQAAQPEAPVAAVALAPIPVPDPAPQAKQ